MKCEICGDELKKQKHQKYLQKKQKILSYKHETDPGDLNILIVHSDRCGVSWFVRVISLIYEQMYGTLKKWNVLISRLMAAHPDYAVPKGWNTVLYVPIEDVVKKKHDKIILLQRDLDDLKKANFIYRYPDKDYEIEKDNIEHKRFFDKIEYYYKITYNPKIKADNLLRVSLEDLNQYTVATFHEVLDFLEFPKEGRPIILPVNPPERNWQVFSSVLNKKQKINTTLYRIWHAYNKKELEFIEQGNHSLITSSNVINPVGQQSNTLLPIEKKIQKNWNWKMNPKTLDIEDALDVINKKNKKTHVVLIGAIPNNKGCHFSEHARIEFENMKLKVTSLNMPQIFRDLKIMDKDHYHVNWIEIQKNKNIKELKPQKTLSIKKILRFYNLKPSFVFIDGTRYKFINDTEYIVFFNHNAWYKPISIEKVDYVFMKNESYVKMHKEKAIFDIDNLAPSVDLNTYYPEEKKINELTGIGYRRSLESWEKIAQPIPGYKTIMHLMYAEINVFKKCGYNYYDNPINDEKYRQLLRQMKLFWFPIPYSQYITRRMLESLACKCLPIIRFDDKEHEKYLKKLGFNNNEHYIGFNKIEDIPHINEIIKNTNNIDKIIERGYNVVLNRHTHKKRVEQIINIYKKFIKEKVDVIVPLFNIKEDILSYIDNWFECLPIRKLFLGIGKDKFNLPDDYKYKNKIIIINQTEYKTLGMCIADLMKKVQTKWFVFLHSDVKIKKETFIKIKENAIQPYGGIEAGIPLIYRITNNKMTINEHSRMKPNRAYSGFQLFRTAALKYIINKIEDDYIYRNEDIIFQNAVTGAGYKYIKLPIRFNHYNQGEYIKNKEDVQKMFYGIFKYTYPTKITKYIAIQNIEYYIKHYGSLDIDQLKIFLNQNHIYNNEWKKIIRQYFNNIKK